MRGIKTISRNWIHPEQEPENENTFSVGKKGVVSIHLNEDNGCFQVDFDSGIRITLTDVNYVNWGEDV